MNIRASIVFLISGLVAVSSGCGRHSGGDQQALISLALPLAAANQTAASPDAEMSPVYLAKDSIPAASIVPPPFAEGSAADLAELSQIHELQASRTAPDCARARVEATPTLATLFGPAYGPLSGAEVAGWSPFFDKIFQDVQYFVTQVKDHWKRERPYVEDQSIAPCVPLAGIENSYPSGHAALARVFSKVLDELAPGNQSQINLRAEQVAADRVLGGVHHLSDIEAGEILGDRIFEALQANGGFERDLKAAKSVAHPDF